MSNMTLYEFMKMSECDYDTYDVDFDAIVTVCLPDEDDDLDAYGKFCFAIIKKVNVVEVTNTGLIVDWSGFVKRNIEQLREFTDEYWYNNYADDEDEFVYQWINEIHAYLAGYVSEDIYEKLVKLVETLV
jgi:hypothetical protein